MINFIYDYTKSLCKDQPGKIQHIEQMERCAKSRIQTAVDIIYGSIVNGFLMGAIATSIYVHIDLFFKAFFLNWFEICTLSVCVVAFVFLIIRTVDNYKYIKKLLSVK